MKVIELKKKHEGNFKGKMMTERDYDVLISDTCAVYKPDGSLLISVEKRGIPMDVVASAWNEIRNYNPRTENRGVANGTGTVDYIRKDGTKSKTKKIPKGYEIHSGIIGYYDRYPRTPYCRKCAWNLDAPEKFEAMIPFFQEVDRVHELLDPEGYWLQKEWADKTNEDFIIKGTIYTSVTVNKNFRTAAHFDAKNLDKSSSAMVLIREGKFNGGHLVLPEWRIAVQLDTSDVVVFKAQEELHGNTKIIPLSKNYQRCTLVHYYRKGMIHCGSAKDELERIKNVKPGESLLGIDKV